MKPGPHELPVACRLSCAEFREREATLLAQFRSAVTATEELADGYAFRLPGDRKSIALVADLIAAERECCPFLAFEVAALSNMGPVTVRVTGPAGTKEFLNAVLCKPGGIVSSFLSQWSASQKLGTPSVGVLRTVRDMLRLVNIVRKAKCRLLHVDEGNFQ